MKVLILSSFKVLLRWSEVEIKKALNGVSPIFAVGNLTDTDRAKLKDAIGIYSENVYEYDNYIRSSVILIQFHELALKNDVSYIVAMSEMDVMRAAILREKIGLKGMKPEAGLFFRDKFLMKSRLVEHGIKVADHHLVHNALDLKFACRELGYPAVIKPPMGRGSNGVSVIKDEDELYDFLIHFDWNDIGYEVPLLVEGFVEGDLYRIDGVISQGKMAFISAAMYWGSHLNYLEGGFLGSVMLDPESQKAKDLIALTENVLFDVLPFGDNGSFHVEIFKTPEGEFVFNEAASRLGGGSIIEEVEASFGVNIKTLFLAAEIESHEAIEAILDNAHTTFIPAAQLHISPQPKKLEKAPESCDREQVYLYELMSKVGDDYKLMSHTNSEVARFVLHGGTPEKLEVELEETIAWFKEETVWK